MIGNTQINVSFTEIGFDLERFVIADNGLLTSAAIAVGIAQVVMVDGLIGEDLNGPGD